MSKQLRQETITVESEQTQALARQVPTWVERAQTCKVTTVAQQAAAQQTMLQLKGIIKDAKSWFKSLKTPIDKVKALILEKEHEVVDPLEQALTTISTAVSKFDQAQRAEALRLQREAEIAERKRLEDQRKQDLALLAKETARATKSEKRELRQVVAELKAEPIVVAPVVVQPKVATTEGLQSRQNWRAVVTDLDRFHAGLVAGDVPWEAITVNQTFLNTLARASKVEGELCPGVQCVVDTTYVGRV